MQAPYILIGSQHSLYTGKLRSYLIWRGVPFIELTASAELYKQVILPRTGVAFIPVLVLPDWKTVLQDTHAIISHLEHAQRPQQHKQQRAGSGSWAQANPTSSGSNASAAAAAAAAAAQGSFQSHTPLQQPFPMPGPALPTTPKAAAASQLLEVYGDEWLVIPAMHYRWSFPQQRERLLYLFGSTNIPTGTYEEQMAAGAKVAARFAGMLPGLGITPDSIPTIEARFKWQLAVLQEHFKSDAYLLGSTQPTLADSGFIGPLLAHLYLDPVPSSLVQCTAPLVADYIERLGGMHCHARVVDRVVQHGGATVASGISSSSSSSGSGRTSASLLAGLQPADPERAKEGQLQVKLLRLRGQQPLLSQQAGRPGFGPAAAAAGAAAAAAGNVFPDQATLGHASSGLKQGGRQPNSSSISGNSSSVAAADHVPHAALLLMHHMFLEQTPCIISTLKLLKAWKQQQQQQQQQQQATDLSQLSGASSSSSSGRWLVVPRFLGRHNFTLYDPQTGAPSEPPGDPLQRLASSYVAWRAAEIVGWYQQLSRGGKGAVLELLREVGSVGSSSSVGSTRVVSGSETAAAVGQQAEVTAQGFVDAASAFTELVDLVQQCGRIERRDNKVVVWGEADALPASKL